MIKIPIKKGAVITQKIFQVGINCDQISVKWENRESMMEIKQSRDQNENHNVSALFVNTQYMWQCGMGLGMIKYLLFECQF